MLSPYYNRFKITNNTPKYLREIYQTILNTQQKINGLHYTFFIRNRINKDLGLKSPKY